MSHCPTCGKPGYDDLGFLVNPPDREPEPAPDAGGSWEVSVQCPVCFDPLSILVSVDRTYGDWLKVRGRTWFVGAMACPCSPKGFSRDDEHRIEMAGFYIAQNRERAAEGSEPVTWTDDMMEKIRDLLPVTG